MMLKLSNIFLTFCLSLLTHALISQSAYMPYDHELYVFKDRLSHVYQLDPSYHSSVKKLYLEDLRSSFDTIGVLASHDQFDFDYFKKEISDIPGTEKGLLKYFYKNPAHLVQLKSEDFDLSVNYYIDFVGIHEFEDDAFKYLNKRGLEFWGSLDKKFYFYSSIHENQTSFVNYVQLHVDSTYYIPGQGHYKPFNSSFFDFLEGYDFANANAYIGYKTSKHTHLELGHGKHFMGNGIRSILQSDFAHNYFYLSFNVNVWKFNYQSIVSELSPVSSRQTPGNDVLPKKYMASHYLSFKPNARFEIGLFESVVFSRQDQFEFQYLNPIILYRTVEALFDSPDNVMIGLNLNYISPWKTSIYGQFLLDELKTSEIFSDKGWWGNKWAIQLGLKSFDLFNIRFLDLQLEYNKVRPYTYSHNVSVTEFKDYSLSNYSHFNQPLAHPLGANFSEIIVQLKYRILKRLSFCARYLYTQQGKDPFGNNYGSNILLNNSSRISDFGIDHLQGEKSDIRSVDLFMSYCLLPEFYLDVYAKFRTDKNASLEDLNTNYLGLGFRYNISRTQIDY